MTEVKGISSFLCSLPEKDQHEVTKMLVCDRPECWAIGPCGRTETGPCRTAGDACWCSRESSLHHKMAFCLRKHFVGLICHQRQSTGHCLEWGCFGKESHVTQCEMDSSLWDGNPFKCSSHFPVVWAVAPEYGYGGRSQK